MANTHSLTLSSGSNQYLYIADNAPMSITADLTIEAWIKVNSFPSSGNGFDIFSKFVNLGQYSYIFYIFNDGSNYRLSFTWSPDGSSFTTADKVISLSSVWTHVAVAFSVSAFTAEFFVNASSIGTSTGSPYSAIFDGVSDVNIGRRGSGSNYFDGLMDDVRLWNDIRTSSEISANYQRELGGNEANLVAYYKFNNNYNDLTSNALTLTPNGIPVFTSDVPFADSTTTSTSTTSTSSSTSTTSTSTSTTSTSTSRTTSTSTTSTSTSKTTSTSTTLSLTTSTSTTSTSTSTTSTSTSTTSTSTSTSTSRTTSTSTTTTLNLRFVVEKVK